MIRKLHRLNAMLLGVFICIHLANHLTIIGGADLHLAVMQKLRIFYRPLVVELLLYALFASQIALGTALTVKRKWPRDNWTRAQVVSGGVLAIFLVQHMSATIITRLTESGIDTNIYWAASVVSQAPHVWYFGPYYALGIIALFVHVAAALNRRAKLKMYAPGGVTVGVLCSAIIVPSLMGWYGVPIELPMEYQRYVDSLRLLN